MGHAFYRPISQCTLAAGLDEEEDVVGLHVRISGQSINASVNPAQVVNNEDNPQPHDYTARPGNA
jgi:isoquinoline 1-oxidoreductase subunit beta